MKLVYIFSAVAGLALVSAAPPEAHWGSASAVSSGYPPCSRTVTDRCIQLYERGVRTPENLAMNRRLGPGRVAGGFGGPYDPEPVREADGWREAARGDYPVCSATITDRCIQRSSRRRR